jgi:hypothetical protein
MQVHQNASQLEETLDLLAPVGNREGTEMLPAERPGAQDGAQASCVGKVKRRELDQQLPGSVGYCSRSGRFESWRCRDVQVACQGDAVPILLAVYLDAEVPWHGDPRSERWSDVPAASVVPRPVPLA